MKNISNEITDIKMDFSGDWGKGIDDWPENYNINSITKFLGECIVKIQMLPLLIKDAVSINDQNRIYTCNFILSDLFNIYNAIKESNNSLLSPILKEYKDSFESMFFKLKKSDVDFSKDEDSKKLLKLSMGKENKIQDYIIMPDKDSFTISENKLQKFNKKTANKYMNKAGIGSVSDISKMKEKPKEKEVPINNKPKIPQETKNLNKNKTNTENPVKTEETDCKKEKAGINKTNVYIKEKDDQEEDNGENNDNDDKGNDKPEQPDDNPPTPPPKCNPEDFANIPCDIAKEAKKIIKNMEELAKNNKEKEVNKLKYEDTDDLFKRYNNKELEEELKKIEKEDKNSIIMKLIEDSEYLSNEIIYK